MVIEKRDGEVWADVYWDDLSAKAQEELSDIMGDNGNFDVFPFASINVSGQEDEGITAPRISAESIGGAWIDGIIDDYRFQAKVYDTGSRYGINKGRVSKLEIWGRQSGGVSRSIVRYDRGWDKKPATDEHKELLEAVLGYLEEFPPEEHRDGLS